MNLENILKYIGNDVAIDICIAEDVIWTNNYDLCSPNILFGNRYSEVISIRASESKIIITIEAGEIRNG